MISEADVATIVDRCRDVPRSEQRYVAEDFVTALVETVVDFQQHTTTVVRAMEHFTAVQRPHLPTLDALLTHCSLYPDTQAGNTALAKSLWGYKLWTRAHMLRQLAAMFDEIGVRDLDALRAWAAHGTFERDFQGRVKGLGPTVYNWLVMRLGVETVKPDVHLRRFVEQGLGRRVSDRDIVEVVSRAASELGMRSFELDWSIWEYERGA